MGLIRQSNSFNMLLQVRAVTLRVRFMEKCAVKALVIHCWDERSVKAERDSEVRILFRWYYSGDSKLKAKAAIQKSAT